MMGLTGLAWSLFVLTHMLGNMLIFAGADAYNKYSHALISNPFIYIAELGLLLTLGLHVYDGIMLTIKNKWARPVKSNMPTNGHKAARYQSKWMIFHGSMLLIFIILHLITFKYGPHYTTNVSGVEMRDLYRLVMEVFHSPGYVIWYLVCMVILGLHLSHGFYSSFATLGFYHPRISPILSRLGYVYAVIIALGFISQPLYVYAFPH